MEGRLSEIKWRVVIPDVQEFGSKHVCWSEVAGRSFRPVVVCLLCISLWLSSVGCIFGNSPMLLQVKSHISKGEICVMLKWLPNIPIIWNKFTLWNRFSSNIDCTPVWFLCKSKHSDRSFYSQLFRLNTGKFLAITCSRWNHHCQIDRQVIKRGP